MNDLIQILISCFKFLKNKVKSWIRKRIGVKEYIVNIKIVKNEEELSSSSKDLMIDGVPVGKDILVLPTNSISTVQQFMRDNKDLAYGFIFKEMKRAISENKQIIELFRVGETPFVARIKKEDYEKSLLDMQQYYIESEEYEKAEVCDKMLKRNRVNQLIELSKEKE